jgi:hypothetical protein
MLPYWYGPFHDTDTYFCRPLLEAGHFEQAACNLSFRHRTLARALEIAAENRFPGRPASPPSFRIPRTG